MSEEEKTEEAEAVAEAKTEVAADQAASETSAAPAEGAPAEGGESRPERRPYNNNRNYQNRGDRQERGDYGNRQGGGRKNFKRAPRKRVCAFCKEKIEVIDYKDVDRLKEYVTESGKMIPRRMNGNCAKHQREVAKAIKRARIAALLPFIGE